jgi:hypothetical protein
MQRFLVEESKMVKPLLVKVVNLEVSFLIGLLYFGLFGLLLFFVFLWEIVGFATCDLLVGFCFGGFQFVFSCKHVCFYDTYM